MTSTSGRFLARVATAPEAEVPARGGQAGEDWPSTAGMGGLVRASPARIGSPVDVRLGDVKLVCLLQLGRAGRLHVVANRPELELAEVQRFLLCGYSLRRGGCAATLRALSTWRSASCTARRMVMFSARICPSLMNPSPLPGLSGSNAQPPWNV